MLFVAVAAAVIFAYVIYFRALRRLDNFYSDDVRSHISWVVNCIYLFIGLGILATISPFSRHYSTWLRVFYLASQFAVYTYIYWRSHKYELTAFALAFAKSAEDDEFVESAEETSPILSQEVAQAIKSGVNRWIAGRGYASHGVTLKNVALEICTNRTYLSSYINLTYKCSFKVWITRLRIGEAKRLLNDERIYSVSEIASKVGFTSASSFIHIFRNMEGEPPVRWRELHRGEELHE